MSGDQSIFERVPWCQWSSACGPAEHAPGCPLRHECAESERLRTAIREADEWWWHEAHGLHDTAGHEAHGGLVACVPLLTRTEVLRAERASRWRPYL